MRFEIKQTKNKEACTYKTLYIRRALLEQIECIAAEHHTSFNHVVVSMIAVSYTHLDVYKRQLEETARFLQENITEQTAVLSVIQGREGRA